MFKKPSKEQIEALKKEHGNVFMYESKDGKICLLKKPSLQILDACRSTSGGSSIKFDQALIDNCIIEGDEVFTSKSQENEKYRLGLMDWLGSIIVKVDGQLKEL